MLFICHGSKQFMKVNSVNNQNFRGRLADNAINFIAKHPVAIASLAGSSVIGQKIVMSGAEATIGPAMDIAIGKTITNISEEKDGRTMQSSKVQAVRTSAQAIGGTITGIIIRGICIAASTALLMKAGQKSGEKLAQIVNPQNEKNLYKFTEQMSSWGKNIGGAIAIGVMMVTNFLVDPPIINGINKKFSDIFLKQKDSNIQKEDK